MPENKPEPDEYGLVRVKDADTGYKRSIPVAHLPHGNYTVLKSPASDANGDPVPPEFPEKKAEQGSQPAPRTPRARKRAATKKATAPATPAAGDTSEENA